MPVEPSMRMPPLAVVAVVSMAAGLNAPLDAPAPQVAVTARKSGRAKSSGST